MLSEDFDKKIKEAAEHHYPAYNEHAWGGMRKLLDKHMPEEKDKKRRGIFFLLFFLLLAGGTVLLFATKFNRKVPKISVAPVPVPSQNTSNESIEKEQTTDMNTDKEVENVPPVPESGAEELKITDNKPAPVKLLQSHIQSGNTIFSSTGGRIKKKKNTVTDNITETGILQDEAKPGNASIYDKESKVGQEISKSTEPVISGADTGRKMADIYTEKEINSPLISSVSAVKPESADSTAKSSASGNDITLVKNSNQELNKAPKTASAKRSSFFISLSTAADVSYTTGDKLGKLKGIAGVGFGYVFKEKFTLRTGFFSGRKIYTASPGQYHGPDWFYLYYPNLQKVEANCKVNEIPVSLSYNFGKGKKHNWFVSGGASALIMKEETYNYYYKYLPTGPTINQSYTIQNENKHFFSIMTLSGGYQRKIGNRFSILAEPYLKLPLSGVGAGKVMLNSTGVLLTLTATPFRKR